DEDHDRMYVGSKDYVLSLDLHDINREPLIIHWAASPQRIEECILSGKDGNGECGNFVRLIQPWNRTHLYVCGTGAYNPMCTYVNRGRRAQAPPWTQTQMVKGRGSRATDGTNRPTPTIPLQCPQVLKAVPVGLLSASVGPLQARNSEATRITSSTWSLRDSSQGRASVHTTPSWTQHQPSSMKSSMQECTSILWALMQPSSVHLESRQPCAQISTTPGGSMTLHSSMLSSSLTAQSAMMTSSTSSSVSALQRLRRIRLYMPASGASALMMMVVIAAWSTSGAHS
uniref:Semaphorin-3F n=1 Tax=Nannospalax galili TaxID=1026970 RepID=A0A8C6RDQ3_NANGA